MELSFSMMCLFSSSQAPGNDDGLIRRPGSQCPQPLKSAHSLSRQIPVLGILSKAGVKWSLAWIKSAHYCIHVNIFKCTVSGPVLTVASRSFTWDPFKRLWNTFKVLRREAGGQLECSNCLVAANDIKPGSAKSSFIIPTTIPSSCPSSLVPWLSTESLGSLLESDYVNNVLCKSHKSRAITGYLCWSLAREKAIFHRMRLHSVYDCINPCKYCMTSGKHTRKWGTVRSDNLDKVVSMESHWESLIHLLIHLRHLINWICDPFKEMIWT